MPSKLAKCIVSPKRLVRMIEWKSINESILIALDMTRERVGLASAHHTTQDNFIHPIKPLQINHGIKRSSQIDDLIIKLQSILEKQKVDGLIVHWPLSPNGHLGKACGRTLYFLDRLADQKVISSSLPIALWDARKALLPTSSIVYENPPDKWGRSEAFSLKSPIPTQKKYISTSDQYSSPDSSDARAVLHDFLSSYFEENQYILGEELDEDCFVRDIDEYEAHPYFQESLL